LTLKQIRRLAGTKLNDNTKINVSYSGYAWFLFLSFLVKGGGEISGN